MRGFVGAVAILAVLVAACTDAGETVSSEAAGTATAGQAPEAEPPATAVPQASPSAPEVSRRPSPEPTPSPTLPAAPSPSPTPEAASPAMDSFDADRALAVATALANAGPRPAGTRADAAARMQIAMRLWSAGWDVTEQPFSLPQGGESANVIATLGPTFDRPHVVIGAHLDTVAGSPGANDNASGIGVLVALAEELADEAADLPVPVVLVAFGAEEYQPSSPRQHHIGSEIMAADPTREVVAMLSVDMIGNGDTLCICWLATAPDTLAQRLAGVAEEHGIDGVEVRTAPDWSDHGPFAHRGVPAAFLWTGIDGRYHSPADTAEHLRIGDIDRAGDLVLAFVRSLRPADVDRLG